MSPLQWLLRTFWSAALDDPVKQVPPSQECDKSIDWWFGEERWASGIPLGTPSFTLFFILMRR